jgi:uncharacterized phage protein (TIGR01671 family)
MQDRFKFRVWDKFCETWLTDFAINQDGEINKFFNSEEALKRRFVLMQCTGLKDKNGKLIYEGDVVNGTCGVYWGEMIVKFNENEAKFYMYRIDKRYTDLHFHGKNQEDNFELEVIGNIYENPELLEV